MGEAVERHRDPPSEEEQNKKGYRMTPSMRHMRGGVLLAWDLTLVSSQFCVHHQPYPRANKLRHGSLTAEMLNSTSSSGMSKGHSITSCGK